ncbi:hypothetical protein FHG87_003700 [Trinorchestia longiramus]|nr:hypothetical protein FHG87_003700 [Trinorchestia longiramus]
MFEGPFGCEAMPVETNDVDEPRHAESKRSQDENLLDMESRLRLRGSLKTSRDSVVCSGGQSGDISGHYRTEIASISSSNIILPHLMYLAASNYQF